MGLVSQFTIQPLDSKQSGDIQFFTPQNSDETMLVQVPRMTQQDLFMHRFQTDQLSVVRGSLVIVVLINKRYEYIVLSDRHPTVLTIPPNILHGAINLASDPCLVINAVLRHGPPHELDYRPHKPPFPYDLAEVRRQLMKLEFPVGV